MMEPALQLALHGTAYRTGAVTSARRVLMNYELGGCAGDRSGPLKGANRPFSTEFGTLELEPVSSCLGVISGIFE